MSEFLTLLTPEAALARLLAALALTPSAEMVSAPAAAGRVLAAPVIAPLALPGFARSTVDGYAVRAADTFGAGESLPAYLVVSGEVLMGRAAGLTLAPGQCAQIHTGGMLPSGADAVVMVEHTQEARSGEIEVRRAAAAGENVLQPGEDVAAGDTVLGAGTRLRPAAIGGLTALGLTDVAVARRPRVAIISSGDEVVAPGQPLGPGQVYDVNTYALQALISAAGGHPLSLGIIPDNAVAFRGAAEEALAAADIVVFTAGSSVSVRDLTAHTIDALGRPGVLVHGISIRPGKPTILAACDGKPVIGLPGNPVSALIIARRFVVPLLQRLLGETPGPTPYATARLTINLASAAGREDWVPVRLHDGVDGPEAEPIFGKSNLIFTLAGADGLVCIPAAANGLPAGAAVRVELL